MKKKDVKAEMDYRLAKWVFVNLHHDGYITDEELVNAQRFLLNMCNPPMRCLEFPEEVTDDWENNN